MFIRHWNQESVINNILHLRATGEELSCKYIQTEHKDLYMAAIHNFWSWRNAIIAAGLDYESIRKRKAWNRAKIVKEIKELHKKGEDLAYSRMRREHSDLAAAGFSHFVNWENAITASGLDYEKIRKYKSWDKEEIIEKIKEVYAKGEDLSWHKFSRGKYRRLSHAAIDGNRFGSWGKALEAAGLDYDEIRRYRHWDKRKVKKEIKKLRRQGIELNAKNIQQIYPSLYDAAITRFNSWGEAIESVGLDYTKIAKRRKRSREEIVKELLALRRKGVGLSDTYMRKEYPALHAAACRTFGRWTEARQSIGDHKHYRRKWTREIIIEEIQKLREMGIPLTKSHLLRNKKINLYAASQSKNNFGSWTKAKEVALSQVVVE